jgi:predicted XRE-type DNA-binding protein
MTALPQWGKAEGLTRTIAAGIFGVTQPRVCDLMRGRLNLFPTDTLIEMAATAGLSPQVSIKAPKRTASATVGA